MLVEKSSSCKYDNYSMPFRNIHAHIRSAMQLNSIKRLDSQVKGGGGTKEEQKDKKEDQEEAGHKRNQI